MAQFASSKGIVNLRGAVEEFELGACKLIDGSKLDRGLKLREMKAENVLGEVFRWGAANASGPAKYASGPPHEELVPI